MRISFFSILITLIFLSELSLAQQAPRVGRKAASKYFSQSQVESVPTDATVEDLSAARERSVSIDRLLMLHLGTYTESTSWDWKDSDKRKSVAKATYGITYLWDRWRGLDINLRFDINEYKVDEEQATKISLMPLWTLPLAETQFPLYFGFGAGLGIFFHQLDDESNLSFDYQLMAGARFVDLYENLGAFIEFGMKNHLHLLSDGQVNGTAISAGAVFTF